SQSWDQLSGLHASTPSGRDHEYLPCRNDQGACLRVRYWTRRLLRRAAGRAKCGQRWPFDDAFRRGVDLPYHRDPRGILDPVLDPRNLIMTVSDDDVVIKVRGLVNGFGDTVIHDHIDLDVRRGEVIAVVGGSGTGKSVLLRTIIGLNQQL